MPTGTVKFFNLSKGFGFIIDDATKQEVFVHATALKGTTINENDRVEFDSELGQKGLTATNIKVIR